MCSSYGFASYEKTPLIGKHFHSRSENSHVDELPFPALAVPAVNEDKASGSETTKVNSRNHCRQTHCCLQQHYDGFVIDGDFCKLVYEGLRHQPVMDN
jgi:hypothetical protein